MFQLHAFVQTIAGYEFIESRDHDFLGIYSFTAPKLGRPPNSGGLMEQKKTINAVMIQRLYKV